MNSKLGSGVFPQRLLLSLSVTARIGHTLLNEAQAESCILANLANYYFKALMEILIGPGRIICMGPYRSKPEKAANQA